VDQFDVIIGDTIFAEQDCIDVRSGKDGLVGLVAYAGSIVPHMLKRIDKGTAQ